MIVHNAVNVAKLGRALAGNGGKASLSHPEPWVVPPASSTTNTATAPSPASLTSDSTAIMTTKPRLCCVRLGRRAPNAMARITRTAKIESALMFTLPPAWVPPRAPEAKPQTSANTLSCKAMYGKAAKVATSDASMPRARLLPKRAARKSASEPTFSCLASTAIRRHTGASTVSANTGPRALATNSQLPSLASPTAPK